MTANAGHYFPPIKMVEVPGKLSRAQWKTDKGSSPDNFSKIFATSGLSGRDFTSQGIISKAFA